MTKIQYSSNPAAAWKQAEAVLFLAPESMWKRGWMANVCSEPWATSLDDHAREAKAGIKGCLLRGLGGRQGPKRIALGILPDKRSHHNTPARTEAIRTLVRKSEITDQRRAAIVFGVDDPDYMLAVLRGAVSALPIHTLRADPKPKPCTVRIAAADEDGVRLAIAKRDRTTAEFSRWAAQLVDMPAADLHTPDFVRLTRRAAKDIVGLTVSVMSGKELLDKNMGGLHAVGRTAIHPPKLMILRYRPAKAKRTIALIGKGIVYDTGGLSIKVGNNMPGMKCDMGGAAAVTGAALALASNKHKDAVVAAVALAENAIGPDAYRPDDVLKMHSGHTVEIYNTDAEGRLVLADAASYAARKFKPDAIIDMATLTGAQLIATGVRHAGVVSNRQGLENAATRAGKKSGDLVFPMPFAPEFYQSNFASKIADMKNSVINRMDAQSSCAGQFVYNHIDDLDIPWLHVDLAGPAFRDERGTGFGVALVTQLLQDLQRDDLK